MSLLARLSTLSRASARSLTTVVATAAETASAAKATPAAGAANALRPHHAVVSVSGRDKTGIVKTVTSAVEQHDGNVEESRMALLGGDFAMIVYISMKNELTADRLSTLLRSELPDFSITVRETSAPSPNDALDAGLWSITLEGPDHPGIILAVSQALALNGSNVKEMDTETTTAPFAGYELFKLSGKVSVDESRLNELSSALDGIEERFGTTISLVKESN